MQTYANQLQQHQPTMNRHFFLISPFFPGEIKVNPHFSPCLLTPFSQILQGPRAFRPSWRMGRARHRDLRRGHRGERRGARHGQRRQQRRPLAALALQREHGAKRRGTKIMDFVMGH